MEKAIFTAETVAQRKVPIFVKQTPNNLEQVFLTALGLGGAPRGDCQEPWAWALQGETWVFRVGGGHGGRWQRTAGDDGRRQRTAGNCGRQPDIVRTSGDGRGLQRAVGDRGGLLEIAGLWPHLMRDVPMRDVPAVEGRTAIRTH